MAISVKPISSSGIPAEKSKIFSPKTNASEPTQRETVAKSIIKRERLTAKHGSFSSFLLGGDVEDPHCTEGYEKEVS